MQELLSPGNIHKWLPVAVGLSVALFSIPFLLRGQRQARQARELLARKTGLAIVARAPLFPGVRFLGFLTREPYLDGSLSGRQVRIRQTHSDKKNWTEIDTALEGDAIALRFSEKSFFHGLALFTKRNAVETGDARFDERYLLKSDNPLAATIFTLPVLREAVEEVWGKNGAKGTLEVKPGFVRYREVGMLRSEKAVRRIEAAARLTVLVATAAEAVAESSGRRDA